MRNRVFGSYRARGKKKRRNIRKLMPSDPSTAAITNRRRRAMVRVSSGSSSFEKMFFIAAARDGLGLGGGEAVPAGSTLGFAIFPQSAAQTHGLSEAGKRAGFLNSKPKRKNE